MRCRRAPRALTSWIAALALLVAALAPSISHALSARTGASWVEVCTTLGAKWVQQDGASADRAPVSGDAHPFEHCPYCSLHANDLALPPAAALLAPAPAAPGPLPNAWQAPPRTQHAWRGAQPRGPPSVS